MMTVTVQENPDLETSKSNQSGDSRFLSDEQHRKALIKSHQRQMQILADMKEKEKQSGISQGRKKWFNHQVKDLRQKIQELEKGDGE